MTNTHGYYHWIYFPRFMVVLVMCKFCTCVPVVPRSYRRSHVRRRRRGLKLPLRHKSRKPCRPLPDINMADKVLKFPRKHVFRLVTNFSGMFTRNQTFRAIKFPKNNFTVQGFSRLGTFGVLKNVSMFTSLASGAWLLQYIGKEAACYDGNRISPDAKIFRAARHNDVDEIKR